MGDAGRQQLCLRGLGSAAGYLQARIAREIELRYTPKLTFILDQGVKHSIEIARILKEVLPENQPEENGRSEPPHPETPAQGARPPDEPPDESLEPL